MRNKTKRFLLIFVGLLLLHDNGLIPFEFSWYKMTEKVYGSFCEVQDGALAGGEANEYRFIFLNGETNSFGNGDKIIELREKEKLSLGVGSYFPLFKTCTPTVEFECYDMSSDIFLGIVAVENKYTVRGLISRSKFKKMVYSSYMEQVYSKLKEKEIYIDQLQFKNGVTRTRSWDARQVFKIDLSEIGESIAPTRRINLKKQQNSSRDSILFSTHLGQSNQYHHEIISSNREKGEMVIQRFSNDGKLVLEAIFTDHNISKEWSLKQHNDDRTRVSGLTLSKYTRFDHEENLTAENKK